MPIKFCDALGLAAAGLMKTSFGRTDSFRRHLAPSYQLGLRVAIYRSLVLGFDVDTVDDYRCWLSQPSSLPAGVQINHETI